MPPIDGAPGSLPETDTDVTNVIEGEVIPPSTTEGDEGSAPRTDDTASSSEAPKTDDRKTLLDATRAAVKPSIEAAASSAKANTDAATAEGNKTVKPDGTGQPNVAEDDPTLPFHNHPRWRALIAERNNFRADAIQYRTIDTFMRENRLNPQETAEGMVIMGLMKNDPEAAYERLLPHMQKLGEFLGKTLPADLKEQVDAGTISEEAAKETAMLRRKTEAATAHAKQLETSRQAEQAQQQTQQLEGAMKGAVDTWETTVRRSDPDFAKKAVFVTREIKLLIATHGKPKSAADAVEYAKHAYKVVNDQLKGTLPAARKTSTPPPQTPGSHSAAPKPKTFAEAVRFAAGER